MDFEKVQDPLKSLDEICEPDKRQKLFLGISLNGNHAKLSRIKLNRRVPVEVRQLFETAKNLNLYSWFVYRFHQVSELTAYSALEMVLRLRYEKEVGKKRRVTFRKLLGYAQENNWIDNNRFSRAYRNETARRKAEHEKLLEAVSGALGSGESIPIDPPTEQEVLKALNEFDMVSGIVDSFAILRNELAHGSSTLHPNSIATLEVVAEVINQIYKPRL